MRSALRRTDRAEQDHGKAALSGCGLREDLVAAFALSVVIAVAGLFLIAAFVWTSRAFAEASAGVDVGGGEVSVDGAEVYAGDGCVKAGDVVVGDCGDGGSGDAGGDDGGGGGDPVDTPPTTMPEMTSPEMTSQEEEEATGETTEETTAPEATSTEQTTDPETTEGSTEKTGLDQIIPPPTVVVSCPTGPTGSPTGSPTGATHEATVTRVVDGDTFEISGEIEGTDRVRLIGVDSPEMDVDGEAAGEDPEPGAERAKSFSAEALEGEDVVLETDREVKDEYGRLLAYVWTGTRDTAEATSGNETENTAATEAVEKELEKRGLLSELRRLVQMDTADGEGKKTGGAAETEMFNATLLEAGHADVLTVEPNDAYAECFEAIGEQKGQGGAAGEQYATTDEQYGDEGTTVEEIVVEETVVEETDPEQTVPREPEETTSELPETTMESAQPVEPMEPVEETTSGESTRLIVEETTGAADEQYDAPTDTGTTVPETEQPATTPKAVEETTSAGGESEAQAEAAPPAEISLAPPAETAPLPAATDETLAPEPEAESVPEPLAESYTPSVTATETGSLPTVQTSEGPMAVLPDTGGPSFGGLVAPVLGAACIGAGTLGFFLAALPGGRLRRGLRPARRGASEPR